MIPQELRRLANQVDLGLLRDHQLSVARVLRACAELLQHANRHVREAYRSDNKTETLTSLRELKECVEELENTQVDSVQ